MFYYINFKHIYYCVLQIEEIKQPFAQMFTKSWYNLHAAYIFCCVFNLFILCVFPAVLSLLCSIKKSITVWIIGLNLTQNFIGFMVLKCY